MTHAGRAPVEIELKLAVNDVRAARRLLRADTLAGLEATSPAARRQVTDRYVDTEAHALEASGVLARLRDVDGSALVTVKSRAVAASADGVHRRMELEAPGGPSLDPTAWPPSEARTHVEDRIGGQPLVETATLRQDRLVRRFGTGGTTIELSLDRVTVLEQGRRVGAFVELEAELIEGDEQVLAQLVARLHHVPALMPARRSKLDRAMAALERDRRERARPRLSVGPSPGVLASDSIDAAARKVMAFHFDRVLAREPGVREGEDPTSVHQMRVATRRMRAAWRAFADATDAWPAKTLERPLQRVARALGAVRDLDVLLAEVRTGQRAAAGDDPVAQVGGDDAPTADPLGPYVDELVAQRERAHKALVQVLDSRAHARWLERMLAFLAGAHQEPSSARAARPRAVHDLAPARIWRAYGRVRAFDGVLAAADVPTLHALRIEGKRLRYSLEFVREALGEPVDVLIARVTALQDHLGALHDADVAAASARAYLSSHEPRLTSAEREELQGWIRVQEAEVRRLHRGVGVPWRGLAGVTFRRGLGRAVAAL